MRILRGDGGPISTLGQLVKTNSAVALLCIGQALCLALFLFQEHEIKPEWLSYIEIACQGTVSATKIVLTPARQTYGKAVFAMGGYLGSIIGCLIEKKLFDSSKIGCSDNKSGFVHKSIDSIISGIPMFPLMAGTFLVSKKSTFELQLIFRYFGPPILTSIYIFGFSEAAARKINSQAWPLIGSTKQASAKPKTN